MIGRGQDNQVLAAVVLVNANDVEQVHGEADETGVIILLFNALSQRLRFFPAVGVDLQQAVTALFKLRFQRVVLLAAGLNQIVKAVGVFRRGQIADQIAVHLIVNGAARRAGMFKRIQTFVEPAHQHGLGRFFQIRHVDLNIVRLTDTIQTTDTLLQQIRVERQIEHHQVAGELEVTAFRTDFRTQHNLSAAVLFGKPRRSAVAFNDGHAFVEHGGANAFALAQDLFQLQRGGRLGADHQHLLGAVRGQVAHQPLYARIEVPPGAGIAFKFLVDLFRVEHVAGALFLRFARAHDAGNFNCRLILRRQRQLNGMQFAFREPFHTVTGVTEQDATGAVAIHQHVDQLFTRGFRVVAVAVSGLQQRLDILLANQIAQGVEFVIRKTLARQQQRDGIRNRTVVILFFHKLPEVVETVWIEQAQTGEVAFQAQLFRRSGQQQDARHALGKLLDSHIFAARRVFAPDQVVRFVDHHQVPLGIAQMLKTLLAAAHEVERTNHQLFGFKRVVRIVLGFGVAFVIEQREAQVKAAQHLNQPLVL